MNKFWIVLRKEYLSKVNKKSFVIITFLTPLLIIAITLVPMLLGMSARDNSEKTVMVIDQTNKYFDNIASQKSKDGFKFVKGDADIAQLRDKKDDNYYAYVMISDDLLVNPKAITIYSHSSIVPTLGYHISEALEPALRKEKIDSYGIPGLEKIIDDTKVSINVSSVQWSDSGEEKESSAMVAMVIGEIFNILLFMFVITYGSMVMTSVMEEKKSRIVEIIASSVKPTTLLFAKMVAIGLVGVTQVMLWAILLVLAFILSQVFMIGSATLDLQQLSANMSTAGDFDPEMIQEIILPLSNFNFGGMFIAFIFYFICAYLSFASIFAAIGAAMDSDEDVSQMTMPITLFMLFGFYAAFYSADNPFGPLALWGSFIPFIGPNVMMVRLPFDPPVWQIVVSTIMMVVTTLVMVWLAAKIFRVGLLMYGKKPSVKEMIKWVSYK
ncbi:ABC transporter permease [Porphyromonadaceae bacterium W3.11]|nr:ABC transporter permease [Porphyromonadaceae bacterium W3.11]